MYHVHHYAYMMDTAMSTQKKALGFIVNCEVALISYFCDKLCSYS